MKIILIALSIIILPVFGLKAETNSELATSLDALRSQLMTSEVIVPTLLEEYRAPNIPEEFTYGEKYVLYRTIIESYYASQLRHQQGYYIDKNTDFMKLAIEAFPKIDRLPAEGGKLISLGEIELLLRKEKIKQNTQITTE